MMPAQNTTLAIGVSLSFLAGGPLSEVFNEMGLLVAIMGALGGISRTLSIRDLQFKAAWRRGLRDAWLGGLLAFGIGVMSLPLLEKLFGFQLAPDSGVNVFAAGAFAIGFFQERVTNMSKEQSGGE